MRQLPDNVRVYKRTRTFDQDTLPSGLQNEHRTRAGVWGRIVIEAGTLLLRFVETGETHVLSPEQPGIVAPEEPHEVELSGAVQVYVEFLRAAE